MHRLLRVSMSSEFVLAALFTAISGPVLRAETAILASVKDNTVFSDLPSNSNGRGAGLFAGHIRPLDEGGGARRSLIAFDLVGGGVPVGATIQSAALTLFFEQGGTGFGDGQTFSLHPLLDDWGEGESIGFGGQGAAAAPGDATWAHRFFDGQFWTTPGGDFAPTASASQFVTNESGTLMTWNSTEALVADVQNWADAPSCSFGWILIGDEIGNRTSARFTSRDSTTPANHPRLSIEFTPPGPRLDGDLDLDGDVDREDVAQFVTNLGLDRCGTMNHGDFTNDGLVGLADLALLQSQFGQPAPLAANAVPEPETWLLGGIIILVSLRHRRPTQLLKFAP
jgi:hypothetical protein